MLSPSAHEREETRLLQRLKHLQISEDLKVKEDIEVLRILSEQETQLTVKLNKINKIISKQERQLDSLEREIKIERLITKNLSDDLESISLELGEHRKVNVDIKLREATVKALKLGESKRLQKLQKQIFGEIDGVYSNLLVMTKSLDEQREMRDKVEVAVTAKYRKFYHSFKRWQVVWPTLHVWLYSESEIISSVNAISILQGKNLLP